MQCNRILLTFAYNNFLNNEIMTYAELIEKEQREEKQRYDKLTESEKRELQKEREKALAKPAVPFDAIQAGYYYIISIKPFGTNATLINAIYSETGDLANGISQRIDRSRFYKQNSYYNTIQSPTFQDYPIEVKDLIHVKKCELVTGEYKGEESKFYSIIWNKIGSECK